MLENYHQFKFRVGNAKIKTAQDYSGGSPSHSGGLILSISFVLGEMHCKTPIIMEYSLKSLQSMSY